MLTFLSRSLREWLDPRRGDEPAPPHAPPRLRLAGSAPDRDTAVAAVLDPAGAAAFVAGQGARIYSLEAFRRAPGPRRPQAA